MAWPRWAGPNSKMVLTSTCCGFRDPRHRGACSRTTRGQIVVRVFFLFCSFFIVLFIINRFETTRQGRPAAHIKRPTKYRFITRHLLSVQFFVHTFNTTRCHCRFPTCLTKYHTAPSPNLPPPPSDRHAGWQTWPSSRPQKKILAFCAINQRFPKSRSIPPELAARTTSARCPLLVFHVRDSVFRFFPTPYSCVGTAVNSAFSPLFSYLQ